MICTTGSSASWPGARWTPCSAASTRAEPTDHERPKLKIKPGIDSGILLTIYDTSKTPEFVKKILASNVVEIIDSEDSADLSLAIHPAQSIFDVDASWFDNEKLLYIRISSLEKSNKII